MSKAMVSCEHRSPRLAANIPDWTKVTLSYWTSKLGGMSSGHASNQG